MFDHILIVCAGNICRSPFGEAVLQALLPQKKISSAGFLTEQSGLIGKPSDLLAQEVARDLGYNLKKHRAKQLSLELSQKADLILFMEQDQKRLLENMDSEALKKSLLFSHWSGEGDIPDPYGKNKKAFAYSFSLILKGAEAWGQKL